MDDLFKNLNIISKHTKVYLDKYLEKYELCSCHRTFIRKIVEQPGITRDKIKNIAHVHPSNTTRIIDYLEEKNYVIKSINEQDKRICNLYPTDRLIDVYYDLVQIEERWIAILTKSLSNEELAQLDKILGVLRNNSVEEIHNSK